MHRKSRLIDCTGVFEQATAELDWDPILTTEKTLIRRMKVGRVIATIILARRIPVARKMMTRRTLARSILTRAILNRTIATRKIPMRKMVTRETAMDQMATGTAMTMAVSTRKKVALTTRDIGALKPQPANTEARI